MNIPQVCVSVPEMSGGRLSHITMLSKEKTRGATSS